jgi:hypothetical protein
MDINLELYRFQSDIDPVTGAVFMQGFWRKVARIPSSEPLIGELQQGFSRSYSNLAAVDEAAKAFPGFAKLAEEFGKTPFTTFAALLEAIRLDEEAKKAEQEPALNQP